MYALKQFDNFGAYEQISVIFGLCLGMLTALGIIVAIFYKVFIILDRRRTKKENFKDLITKQLVSLSHEVALFNQRQEFQSEFMSYQEERYNEVSASIIRTSEDAAMVKLLLQNNNIERKI